jgi:hypothetical protein
MAPFCHEERRSASKTLGVLGLRSRRIEALRFVGQIAMWCGAGFHLPWLSPRGLLVVLLAWPTACSP